MLIRPAIVAWLGVLPGCALFTHPPAERPPLRAMEEPLELFTEPADEAARQDLPAGAFSGIHVEAAPASLEAALGGEPAPGLLVAQVVENSPADGAGIEKGDLLLEARTAGGPPLALRRPSEWRELELETPPGTAVEVVFERANRELRAELALEPRRRPAARHDVERFREEERVGVVVRTATEVEARAAGLGPGGGAVVVGMSQDSPWRGGEVGYGDLLVGAGGRRVTHPQELIAALRAAPAGGEIELEVWRDDGLRRLVLPVSRRAEELHEVWIPLLFHYEKDRDRSSTSVLLHLFSYESTAAAWRFTFLWVLAVGGGDADELVEVSR